MRSTTKVKSSRKHVHANDEHSGVAASQSSIEFHHAWRTKLTVLIRNYWNRSSDFIPYPLGVRQDFKELDADDGNYEQNADSFYR